MNMVAGRSAIALTDLRDACAQSCRDRARGGAWMGSPATVRPAGGRPGSSKHYWIGSSSCTVWADMLTVCRQWTQQLITWCT